MTIRIAAPLTHDSIVDGDGLRTVLWTQGCPIRCPGCHNPHTHDPDGGTEIPIELLKIQLRTLKLQRGLTLSGGEPFHQATACAKLARYAKTTLAWDIWCYTGHTFEELLANKHNHPLLHEIDTLVDGPFVLAKKNPALRFRGSSNQRILKLHNGKIFADITANYGGNLAGNL
ncbi:MAG: anaerobic ribonucleoside-triphosphate reductase activating protein [Puniceicoccales bacterium]|jgi:anaerobic ribonucleoside-triphosphate reductase activating protein|nr:anaerobic ribonucleoside-triphosphate reductase activating protein [Puniceicoccales bacterium]